jgi:hypothetical protein
MIRMTRRELLKALATAGVYGTAMPSGLRRLAFAAEPSVRPILIVLHLRGGCDGLNFVSPASDPDFIAARTSDLRVLTDGNNPGHTLANGPAPNIDFRLHAAAGGLADLYQHGNLAFIHACGLTDTTRSHFVATDMIESGVGTEAGLSHASSGWLARVIEASQTSLPVGLQAIAVNSVISGDLDGLDRVLAIPDANGGLPFVGGPPVATTLWDMYSNYPAGRRRGTFGAPASCHRRSADRTRHAGPCGRLSTREWRELRYGWRFRQYTQNCRAPHQDGYRAAGGDVRLRRLGHA